MGAALQKLGQSACESIAQSLLTDTGRSVGSRMGARCPWHEEKTPGAFWYDSAKDSAVCYSCGNHGDIIDVFCAVQGLSGDDPASFKAFFERFAPGTVLKSEKGGAGGASQRAAQKAWKPRGEAQSPDNVTWEGRATLWVHGCAESLTGEHMGRLAQWGISPETAAACRIGYQSKNEFAPFTSWGLPYAENDKGRERCIHLPQGFVFPVFDAQGRLLRVKVRLDNPREDEPKYKAVVGGAKSCYGIWGDRKSRVWFVVETERDGMLLWQELHPFGIGSMATGSASMTPDAEAHALLSRADLIVNALDNDHAGAAASWGFDPESMAFRWNTAYAHCLRWLTPSSLGKDPTDMVFKASVRDWALSALPHHVRQRCLCNFRRHVAATSAEDF